jgi:undecaprenyl pyrophosphate synthase|tara:strand:- start:148 stop:351 length:204 start_codon:yes stop_codon:yes gene_type:complete
MRRTIVKALRAQALGNIEKAKANIDIYLHNPVGIGEHSDILAAVQDQIDMIAKEEERLDVLEKHFGD